MLAGSVGMVRRAAPRRFVAAVVIQLTGAVAVALQLLVVRGLLAELLDADATFREVAPELVALVVLSGISSATSLLANANYQVLTQLVGLHTAEAVIATATRVDLVAYESPTFHDRLQRAQVSAGTRPTQLTNGVIGLLGSALSIVGVGVALLVIQPLFCALVLVAYVPAWLASHRAGALSYRFSLTQTERERRRWYLFGVLTKKQEAQEVRAFDLVDVLTRRHRELFTEQIADLGDMVGRRLRLSLAGQAATALLSGAAVALLVWFVTSGRLSIAGGGTAAGGVLLLTSRLRGLAGSLGGLYEGALFLDDYSSFVDAASKLDAARPERQLPTGFEVLEARSVSFTYPSRTEPALVDASLVLRRGEVVALVGENGSGKTTFANLLAGLYQPEAGTITWDGVDVAEVDPRSVRRNVTVIFQDFVRYQLSAHDNIALGDPARPDDRDAVVEAATAAGIDQELASLPGGYDALLGPEYLGGSDLSGGQWQRVALARAFFRDAPVVILDEPTAALDPRGEAELFARTRQLFAGRGVLLISHRFGSVRSADRIYVLHDGGVVESGDHDALMAIGGRYAELFQLQAARYG